MRTMDQTILTAFPMLTAPRSGELRLAKQAGTRYVAASDGLWREITLPWIHCIHRIAGSQVALPYGLLREGVQIQSGPIPKNLRQQFVRDAAAACPNEMAAAMIWNQATGAWRYELRESLAAGHAYVNYKEVRLEEGEFLILDLHSHGRYDAYFSNEDDADDAGSMKFSCVIGRLNTESPTTALRLNLLGKIWEANLASDGTLEVFA